MAEKSTEKSPGAFSLLGTASTMGLHMVSGPIVGGGLGWLIDHWLDSWPIAASIGLLLGLAAGFRNVWADARYLERSNAVLDEERKKREEAAVKPEKSREKAREEEKSAAIAPPVPSVHKESEAAGKGMAAASAVREGGAASDALTASILAGTASPEERELEELDETVEAIRRVLEGSGPENVGKGQI